MDLGRVAYAAYVVSCGGLSVHGDPLPTWERQHEAIRVHWRAAADAVVMLTGLPAAEPDVHGHRAFRAFAGRLSDPQPWETLPAETRQAWMAAAAAARDGDRS